MRLWIMSDLHVDQAGYDLPDAPACDVIVIAGDCANGWQRSLAWLRERVSPLGLPVVYVLGNHDYFGGDLDDVPSDAFLDAGITLLQPGSMLDLGGVRLIGSTLWTDLELGPSEFAVQAWAARNMPDYANITRDDGDLIWPLDIAEQHAAELRALEQMLGQRYVGATVVVTHHAPHERSLDTGQPWESAGAFASDLTSTIMAFRPSLWVHGHVHHSSDYRIGGTRVVCNPRGYQVATSASENMRFDPRLIIEVPS